MHSTVQKILCTTLLLSLGLLYVPHVFAVVGDVQLDVSTGGQIIGSALMTNKFTDAANTDYYLDPAAATTSLTVAGSVGIGTTTPGMLLQVRSDSLGTWGGRMGLANATADKEIFFGTYGSIGGVFAHNNALNAWAPLYLNTVDGTNGMVIQGAGNVGIGTTAPSAKLAVAPAAGGGIYVGNGSFENSAGWNQVVDLQGASHARITARTANVSMGMYAHDAWTAGAAGYIGTYTNHPVAFMVNTAQKMVIDTTGNVGIGMDPVGYRLGVTGTNGIYIGATQVNGVGINSSNYGPAGSYGSMSSGTAVGAWGYGGSYDFYAAGGGTDYGSSSSIRWKQNLQPIDHALDKVLGMRGLYYTWDEAHGGQRDMGMIAEEVGQYVPEIVGWDADAPGFATGMDYGHLTPVLVEAIKEQQTQIVSLKSITTDFISKFKEGLIETKKLIVDGVDIVKKLDTQQKEIDDQQKQNDELKKKIEKLEKLIETK